jgi:hypothetical protein
LILGTQKGKKMKTITEIKQQINELEDKLTNCVGSETQVFSRITGHYQPLSNWNKGKTSEYKNRKTFIVDSKENYSTKYVLVIKDHCPNCIPVKNYINSNNVELDEIINASTEEGLYMAFKYHVQATPTLIVLDHEDNVVDRAVSVEQIENILH